MPLTGGLWLNKLWHSSTMGYCPAVKKTEAPLCVLTQKEFQDALSSENKSGRRTVYK